MEEKNKDKKQAKGVKAEEIRLNEFLFGLETGSHTGFSDNVKSGSVTELFMYTPSYEALKIQWRLLLAAGAMSHRLEGVARKSEFGRLKYGAEGSVAGVSSWDNQWLFGLHIGSFSNKDKDVSEEVIGFTKVYFGSRFYLKKWPIKLGVNLGVETVNDENGQERGASSMTFSISY